MTSRSRWVQRTRSWLRSTRLVQKALATPSDPRLGQRPPLRVLLGLALMGLSYIIGWPAIAALAGIAAWVEAPKLLAGGPILYGVSWAIFAAGVALVGKDAVDMAPVLGLALVRRFAQRYLSGS